MLMKAETITEALERVWLDPQPFPVDFAQALQWLGLGRKDNALRTLRESFKEGVDYTICCSIVSSKDRSVCSSKLRSKRGGQNRKDYSLSIPCFKKFCMMAPTPQGDKVRDYYLRVEEMVRQHYLQARQHEQRAQALRVLIADEERKIGAAEASIAGIVLPAKEAIRTAKAQLASVSTERTGQLMLFAVAIPQPRLNRLPVGWNIANAA